MTLALVISTVIFNRGIFADQENDTGSFAFPGGEVSIAEPVEERSPEVCSMPIEFVEYVPEAGAVILDEHYDDFDSIEAEQENVSSNPLGIKTANAATNMKLNLADYSYIKTDRDLAYKALAQKNNLSAASKNKTMDLLADTGFFNAYLKHKKLKILDEHVSPEKHGKKPQPPQIKEALVTVKEAEISQQWPALRQVQPLLRKILYLDIIQNASSSPALQNTTFLPWATEVVRYNVLAKKVEGHQAAVRAKAKAENRNLYPGELLYPKHMLIQEDLHAFYEIFAPEHYAGSIARRNKQNQLSWETTNILGPGAKALDGFDDANMKATVVFGHVQNRILEDQGKEIIQRTEDNLWFISEAVGTFVPPLVGAGGSVIAKVLGKQHVLVRDIPWNSLHPRKFFGKISGWKRSPSVKQSIEKVERAYPAFAKTSTTKIGVCSREVLPSIHTAKDWMIKEIPEDAEVILLPHGISLFDELSGSKNVILDKMLSIDFFLSRKGNPSPHVLISELYVKNKRRYVILLSENIGDRVGNSGTMMIYRGDNLANVRLIVEDGFYHVPHRMFAFPDSKDAAHYEVTLAFKAAKNELIYNPNETAVALNVIKNKLDYMPKSLRQKLLGSVESNSRDINGAKLLLRADEAKLLMKPTMTLDKKETLAINRDKPNMKPEVLAELEKLLK